MSRASLSESVVSAYRISFTDVSAVTVLYFFCMIIELTEVISTELIGNIILFTFSMLLEGSNFSLTDNSFIRD